MGEALKNLPNLLSHLIPEFFIYILPSCSCHYWVLLSARADPGGHLLLGVNIGGGMPIPFIAGFVLGVGIYHGLKEVSDAISSSTTGY